MPQTEEPKQSFSAAQWWLGGLNMTVASLVAFALLVMANYIASGHYRRFDLSRNASFKLSRQTINVLNSLTNDVKITVFFDPNNGDEQEIYGLSTALLAEYQQANPTHLHVKLLDYTRFAGAAKEILTKYDLRGRQAKDFVLFECGNHSKIVNANELAYYDYSELLARRSKYVRRSSFRGEELFTSDIFAVSNPQTLKAYFLYGHGENNPGNPLDDTEKLGNTGYAKLAGILKQKIDCDWDKLSLLGTNQVPANCSLLIVAGPREGEFFPEEVNKIATYLKGGGRLLALLTKPCGLEAVLAKQWGLRLGINRVVDKDPEFATQSPYAFFTAKFYTNAIVNPMLKDYTPIYMVWPRPLLADDQLAKVPGAPEVSMLACTSDQGMDQNNQKGRFDLLASIEQGVVKGVDTPQGGGTRIVVAGDSDFLDDEVIAMAGNHEFAELALKWLLQQPQIMLEGLGPSPISEYRLVLTQSQSVTVQWLFLVGMPGFILALGALVWLRRRR